MDDRRSRRGGDMGLGVWLSSVGLGISSEQRWASTDYTQRERWMGKKHRR